MTRVRVYISTTEAPAEIQRVAEEDPEIRSVICLDGKAVELPVSAAYDSFVRKPTGVIEAEFGHASYRVDVGARITEGLSWQLGIYLAHALAREGRLAGKGEPADRIVLATGEVDRDLHVRAVDHVADKCRVAEPLFAEAAADDQTVILFVPTRNRPELPEHIAGCKVVPVETVQDALVWLGVDRLPRAAAASLDAGAAAEGKATPVPAPVEQRPAPARRRRGGGLALVLAAVVAAVAALGWWVVDLGVLEWRALAAAGAYEELDTRLNAIEAGDCAPCRWAVKSLDRSLKVAGPDAGALALGATALSVPRFRTCRVAAFRPDLLERSPVPHTPGAGFAETSGNGLCAVEYSVTNTGPDLNVMVMAAMRLGEATLRLSDPDVATLPSGGRLPVDVELPARLGETMTVTLFVVAADAPLDRYAPWLERLIGEAAAGAAAGAPLARRLARAGLTLVRADHRIAPAPPRFQ